MRREAITLVFTMGIGTVLMAACDKPPLPEAQEIAPVQQKKPEQENSRQRVQKLPLVADPTRGPEAVQVANPSPVVDLRGRVLLFVP